MVSSITADHNLSLSNMRSLLERSADRTAPSSNGRDFSFAIDGSPQNAAVVFVASTETAEEIREQIQERIRVNEAISKCLKNINDVNLPYANLNYNRYLLGRLYISMAGLSMHPKMDPSQANKSYSYYMSLACQAFSSVGYDRRGNFSLSPYLPESMLWQAQALNSLGNYSDAIVACNYIMDILKKESNRTKMGLSGHGDYGYLARAWILKGEAFLAQSFSPAMIREGIKAYKNALWFLDRKPDPSLRASATVGLGELLYVQNIKADNALAAIKAAQPLFFEALKHSGIAFETIKGDTISYNIASPFDIAKFTGTYLRRVKRPDGTFDNQNINIVQKIAFDKKMDEDTAIKAVLDIADLWTYYASKTKNLDYKKTLDYFYWAKALYEIVLKSYGIDNKFYLKARALCGQLRMEMGYASDTSQNVSFRIKKCNASLSLINEIGKLLLYQLRNKSLIKEISSYARSLADTYKKLGLTKEYEETLKLAKKIDALTK